MTTLMDLVAWFLGCIFFIFTLGGFYIDHATKYHQPRSERRAREGEHSHQ